MKEDERIQQILMLCFFSHWTLDEFKKQLAERYPNGPSPNGNGWNWDAVEKTYNELHL